MHFVNETKIKMIDINSYLITNFRSVVTSIITYYTINVCVKYQIKVTNFLDKYQIIKEIDK